APLQQQIAKGLLLSALRLTTQIARGYQSLADAAVQQREASSSSSNNNESSSSNTSWFGGVDSSSSSKMKKSLGFPRYVSILRRLFAAVSSLGNRGDTPVDIAVSCVAAAACCC